MFRTIVFSAFGAAIAVGVCVSLLQAFTTTPLILDAEKYEGGAHAYGATAGTPMLSSPAGSTAGRAGEGDPVDTTVSGYSPTSFTGPPSLDWPSADLAAGDRYWFASGAEDQDGDAWAPADGFERLAYAVLANAVIGFGIALMLLGLMVAKGDPIDLRRGLLWGVAGFFAVSLLPSLGLPPELPGTPAADLTARQTWWFATAAASAGGIALTAFGRRWWMVAAGAALVVAPHLIGAPQPASHDVPYPGGLAGQFVAASLIVSATMWTLAGAASGWLYRRLAG
jgi:cobalt transporter subunit CbtA